LLIGAFIEFQLSTAAEYKYATAQMLMEDVQLLLSNARSFNGENSEIATHAEKLVSQLQTALNHERKHFGIQGDVINVLEEAIKKK
jgi:Bromodomain